MRICWDSSVRFLFLFGGVIGHLPASTDGLLNSPPHRLKDLTVTARKSHLFSPAHKGNSTCARVCICSQTHTRPIRSAFSLLISKAAENCAIRKFDTDPIILGIRKRMKRQRNRRGRHREHVPALSTWKSTKSSLEKSNRVCVCGCVCGKGRMRTFWNDIWIANNLSCSE